MAFDSQLQSYNQYFAGSSKFRIHIFLDSANFTQYICDANIWTALATAQWRVTRCIYDDAIYTNLLDVMAGSPVWQNLYGEYSCPATNLATVQALDYA